MYNQYRNQIFQDYNRARDFFCDNPEVLIELEQYTTCLCHELLADNYDEFVSDYNEASFLHPFWANYPPDNRGRSPVGDQIPWIEVGEHAIGHKLSRIIAQNYRIREIGIPSGADNRFILESNDISRITGDFTNSVMVFLDIKSVGPRDDFEHTVISPYQVSGDGLWTDPQSSMINSPMRAIGNRAEHPFYPAITPIYVLSDGTVAPTIHVFVKPVYRMLNLDNANLSGQPLRHIRVVCVPNGLLLTINPNYLRLWPGLFFPGKDDHNKTAAKVRCRVSFEILSNIAPWRVAEIHDH